MVRETGLHRAALRSRRALLVSGWVFCLFVNVEVVCLTGYIQNYVKSLFEVNLKNGKLFEFNLIRRIVFQGKISTFR